MLMRPKKKPVKLVKRSQSILDKPITKIVSTEVSESALSFLWVEIIRYLNETTESVDEMEKRLRSFGYRIGWRLVDLCSNRTNPFQRDVKVSTILQFITQNCWRMLYNKPTDQLQRSTDSTNVYYIYENEPLISKFITLPKEWNDSFNCASFNAGIINSILDVSGFKSEVKALTVKSKDGLKTVYMVTIDQSCLAVT